MRNQSKFRRGLMGVWMILFLLGGSSWAQEGYYKDILMDGGIGLTARKTLPVADYLKLSMEYVALPNNNLTEEEHNIQAMVFTGGEHDDNGRLLYPDGAPRFRAVHVRGGSSFSHGETLGEKGRQHFRDFVAAGGSYVGTCAGFSLSSLCRSDFSPSPYPNYLHLWPAKCHYSGISGSHYLNHKIPANSPLLKYYDFGGDNYVAGLRHNMGSYAIENDPDYWCAKSEVLMYHDYPGHATDGKVSSLAYKESARTGRLALVGSHPEAEREGEKRDLMAALVRYALDGNGQPRVKGTLQNGVARVMHNNQAAGHEKIGDKQYHHFTVEITPGTRQLVVVLQGDGVHDLDLFARRGAFAFKGKDDVFASANSTNSNETLTIDNPAAGTWYIGVKGVDTVTTQLEEWGQDYVGDLTVLNGVPYTIVADWTPADKLAVEKPEINRSFRIDFTPSRIALIKEYADLHYGERYRQMFGAPEFPGLIFDPKVLLVHYTAGTTLQGTFNTFRPETLGGRPYLDAAGAVNVGIQFVVDRDGTIYEIQPDNFFGRHVIGLNHCAIGFENVARGDISEAALNGEPQDDGRLTLAQLHANIKLIRYLKHKYPDIEILIGHSEYRQLEKPDHPGYEFFYEKDPDYRTVKSDPGPNFMEALREALKDILKPGTNGQVFKEIDKD